MRCLLGYVLKGSSTVRYPFYVLWLVPLLDVQLFPGSGLYSGIFAIYLQCPSKESRTATIIFNTLCLLYVLSTAAVVCDAAAFIVGLHLDVSSKIFFFSCAVAFRDTIASTSNWLTASVYSLFHCPSYSNRSWWLHRPMYHSKYKPLYLSIVLFTQIFKDLPLLDRVG